MSNREIIIEFLARGSMVKVTAIDAATGREVSTMGPAKTPKPRLKELAVRKLEYVLKKEGLM